jgi:ribonuclease HII
MKTKLLPFNKKELLSYNLEKKIGYGEKLAELKGSTYFVGIDEAGRGPLAGPVVAASVYLNHYEIKELNDSKKLTDKKRRELFPQIIKNMIVGIGIVDEKIIDKINILNATKKAMLLSVDEIQKKIDIELLLIDGNQKLITNIEQITIIKGDSLSYSIAAASIIAKVTRDDIMLKYDKLYPEYGFKNHSGYPTKKHIEAINKYGILDIHRKTFKPIKNLIIN